MKTNALEWLHEYADGFKNIGKKKRNAIMHFSFLWSLFEYKALCKNANATAILIHAKKLEDCELLPKIPFEQEMRYFKNRYINTDGSPTDRFEKLCFRAHDRKELVQNALNGSGEKFEIVAAPLIIVYRIRNNFFHGPKWHYNFAGQHKNFKCANSILMEALDLQNKLESKANKSSGAV